MAISIKPVPDTFDVWGKTVVQPVDLKLDDDYPLSTGYVITAQSVGLKWITGVQIVGGNAASGALNYTFDIGTNTVGQTPKASVALRVFFPTGGAGANPTTLANPGVTVGAIAATLTDAATPTITPGVAKQVPNLADLGTILLRVVFFGI